MDASPSVSDLVAGAAQLTPQELDSLVGQLNKLRIRLSVPALTKEEAVLLQKINEGFSPEKWERLRQLDIKMEQGHLSEDEAQESLTGSTRASASRKRPDLPHSAGLSFCAVN